MSNADLLELENKIKADIKRLNTVKCENSLAEFTKQAWHIIEPGTPLMWNWHLDAVCGYLEATMDKRVHITRLIINVPPGSLKSILVSVMYPAWMWIKNPDKRVLGVSNAQDLAIRDSRRTKQIVTDEWFTSQWPLELKADQSAKTNYENTAGGFRQSLGITANITGKRGDVIVIDDPHDASTAQSDLVRQGVLDVYDTKLSTRVNSQQHSVIILVMQRLHAQDLTGHLLLKKKTKWVHVVMPMHYDYAYTYDAAKDIGRPDLDDPREKDELLFPDLFPQDVVEKLEEDMGTYACTPAETPILMADGVTTKPISEIKVGDKIIGYSFTEKESAQNTHRKGNESVLNKVQPILSMDNQVITTVTETFKYTDTPVLEYALQDGNFVRSTRDHKWYKPFAFMEQSVYSLISCANIKGSVRKAMSQTWNGRKPPSLARIRTKPEETKTEETKTYAVGTAAYNQVKYYTHRGRQDVYALTTGTGNYVAWGHLSSNSAGQLEQRPSPKGGGILRQAWFRVLDNTAELPVCNHIFISCDTAYSEKDMKSNSYSAFTTWGVFWNPAQQRDCILLLDVWYGQVDYPELRRHAHKMDKDKKPDVWLIEKKASGQSLVQDLRQSGLIVRTYVPTTDKVSRAYAIQPMLESGQVWIPDRKWAHAFAYKMGTFPTGDPVSFDLADTCTQALLYIRNGLYVTHPDDLEHDKPEVRRVSAYGGHIANKLQKDEVVALTNDEDIWNS